MIRLACLGRPAIHTDDGPPVDSVASQPKRLALLAYLASKSPEAESRDRLLSIFWPESDPAHARLSLRQAIHFIRSHAAAAGEQEVIVTTPGGKVRVDPARVWFDVDAFDSMMAAGDFAGALALYRGDLLQGVHVQGAPEFDNWLESERARLRRSAELSRLALQD